jgi:pimeloyl-ACP methyl ester carboxylesterase
MSRRADDTSGNHFANGRWKKPRPGWKRLSIPPDGVRPTCQQEQSMLNILLSLATVLLAGTTLVGSVRSAELPKGAAHNIVLVHGAFVDQTSWQPVADILTKKGYNVTLVENPLTSLAADVDATK